MAKLKISEMPQVDIEANDILPFAKIPLDGSPKLNRAIRFDAFLGIILSNIPSGPGGGVDWGDIGGNLTDQPDLVAVLSTLYPNSNPSNFQTDTQVAALIVGKYDASNPANYQTDIQVQDKIANSLTQYSTITYADAREAAAKAYADQLVVGLLDDRGNYDASGNVFPTTGGSGPSGAIKKGDLWTVSVSGMLAGLKVTPGDLVRALVDNPGQTSSNWAVSETNIGYTAEDQSNKSTSITTDQGSNQKYPTVKSVFDWATSVFSTASSVATQIAASLVGYATQSWVNSQGFITNVISALGFTPENITNKAINLTSPDNTKYPTTQAVATALASKQDSLGFTPENVSNKSTSVTIDQASNTKYPSVKAVFDWANSVFTTSSAVASQIVTALTGYATQTWVNAQGFLVANTPITGATKTKITYDSTGRIMAGTDATTADIADSTNKRYITDAQLTAIGTIGSKADNTLVGTPTEIQFAVSDETTALTTGTGKITFRMPYAMSLTSVRGSLSSAQTSGSILTINVKKNGSTIFATKLSFDNTEDTTLTAATPFSFLAGAPSISFADDDKVTIDIDQVGTGGAGLKILFKGTRA